MRPSPSPAPSKANERGRGLAHYIQYELVGRLNGDLFRLFIQDLNRLDCNVCLPSDRGISQDPESDAGHQPRWCRRLGGTYSHVDVLNGPQGIVELYIRDKVADLPRLNPQDVSRGHCHHLEQSGIEGHCQRNAADAPPARFECDLDVELLAGAEAHYQQE